MAALEVLALNESTPQIRAPGASDTYTFPRRVNIANVGALATPALTFGDNTTGFWRQAADRVALSVNGTLEHLFLGGTQRLASNIKIGWSSGSPSAVAEDVAFLRVAAGIIGVRDGTTGGGALSWVEQTAPSAPAANGVYVYAQDNGGGKTQLMALFSSGAAQQIAIQP